MKLPEPLLTLTMNETNVYVELFPSHAIAHSLSVLSLVIEPLKWSQMAVFELLEFLKLISRKI